MTDDEILTVTHRDGVAVLALRHEPVNTLSRGVRRALHRALLAAEDDPAVVGVVITGARNFSAGADLAEFDSGEGLAEPTLHLTIAGLLDRMSTPSVAAISGACLGGGLELALACSARVSRADARIGLPETTLGFMPGAGGTQRLPRAIGVAPALDLILSGRQISGSDAHDLGLVAAVADDPVETAVDLARRLAGEGHSRLRDQPIEEPLARAIIDAARRAARRSPTASAGVRSAIEAVDAGVTLGFDAGLAEELRLFEHLARQPEARAARYRFLSERSSARSRGGEARRVEDAAVIGGGTMGRGIALSLLAAGIRTTVIDASPEAVEAARLAIVSELDRSFDRGRIDDATRAARIAALSVSTDIGAVGAADLVIEAVFEDLDVKLGVFRELDRHARAGAVLASNTSSLDLDVLAAATRRPSDIVGMHFFSPAHVMRLVEVVEGAETSPSTLATAVAVTARLRKLAVVAQVGPGFIGNRIFDAYLRQANLLLRDGVRPADIDAALEAWGMAMGPFRVLDLVGNDVPYKARQGKPADPAWNVADTVVAQGWLGRKAGIGWYDYAADAPSPNTRLLDLLPPAATRIDGDEIVARCILAMVNEAAAVIADGIAASPADVDNVLVNGYGFPARRGGPWFWAELEGLEAAAARMRRWATETGDPSWTPHPLLTASVEEAAA